MSRQERRCSHGHRNRANHPAFRFPSEAGQETGSDREPVSKPQCEGDVSETSKNYHLRRERHTEWRRADALREYWRITLKMDAIERVQNHNAIEGNSHPVRDPKYRWKIIAKWREAIVHQMLTPAPTAREILWKRAVFKHGDHRYTDVTPERIERAIADDVEFLTAHSTRQSRKRGSRAMSALTPRHVLVDLFGSGDFPAEILDPERAAAIVIERLNDAGFEIKPAERYRT